jgi:hypothetical protein
VKFTNKIDLVSYLWAEDWYKCECLLKPEYEKTIKELESAEKTVEND